MDEEYNIYSYLSQAFELIKLYSFFFLKLASKLLLQRNFTERFFEELERKPQKLLDQFTWYCQVQECPSTIDPFNLAQALLWTNIFIFHISAYNIFRICWQCSMRDNSDMNYIYYILHPLIIFYFFIHFLVGLFCHRFSVVWPPPCSWTFFRGHADTRDNDEDKIGNTFEL